MTASNADNYTVTEPKTGSTFKAKNVGGVKHVGHILYDETGTAVGVATEATLAAMLALAQGAGLKVDLATVEGGVTINVANGDFAALGALADAAITNPASSGSLIALAKGILAALNTLVTDGGGGGGGGGGAVTVADGADIALGSQGDAAVTNPATSATLIALIKGLLTAFATNHSDLTTLSGKDFATQTTLALIKTDADTIAGAVSSSKMAAKAASGDFADGALATLGAKADAKSTATDTTAVSAMSVWKQISASVQAIATSVASLVSGTVLAAGSAIIGKVGIDQTTPGTTNAVAATLNAETTKVIGTINVASGQKLSLTDSGGADATDTVNHAVKVNVVAGASGGGAVTIADGADTTLGAKADAKSTATDTTSVSAMSVLKQISASVQAPPSRAVTNAGTFATQSAITAASGALASGSVASGAFASGAVSDGAMVTIGAKADAKSTATDTTAVSAMSVWKQISASVQAIATSIASLVTGTVLAAGSAIIGKASLVDSGGTDATDTVNHAVKVNVVAGGSGGGAVTLADGADTTLGAKADAKSTATDTTSVSAMSVLKQISASVQAPPSQAVTNVGTFAVQAAALPQAAGGTDGSGTITSGGTAQNLFSGATPSNGCEIHNPDATEDLWISLSTTALANGTGSINVVSGGGRYTTPPGMRPFHAVSIVGATTGHKFTAISW